MFNALALFHTRQYELATTMPNLTYISNFIAANLIKPGTNLQNTKQ